MDKTKALLGYDSLAFFGKVTASISHELKNVMAIISETSGLLGDLSDLASTGKPIEPDMLKSCTNSIVEEIQRGFSTIRQMNRFSHSVDTPVESVNLTEMLDMVIHLSSYLSFSGTAYLSPHEGEAPVVSTCPFLLQAIIYHALVYLFKHTGPEAEITIGLRPLDDAAWRIMFPGFNFRMFQVFPDAVTESMARSIGVVIYCDSTTDRVAVDIPATIPVDIMGDHVAPEVPVTGKPSQNRV